MTLLLIVALDREGSIVAALIALIVAALTVSVGAWILLARERRRDRRGGARVSGSASPTEIIPTTSPGRRATRR